MTKKELFSRGESLLDPIADRMSEVIEYVHDLDKEQQNEIVRYIIELFQSDHAIPNYLGSTACKVLISLLPESWNLVQHSVLDRHRHKDYEIQFSFFCWFDSLLYVEDHDRYQQPIQLIPAMIESYLHNVPRNTGSAAWMAGDLLGDHWIPEVALPILMQQSQAARFAAGREGAIHGLSKLLRRLPETERPQVFRLLQSITKKDRSNSVRVSAKMEIKRNLPFRSSSKMK